MSKVEVEKLITQSASATNADAAMKWAQAALNAAQAMHVLRDALKGEKKAD